MSPHAPLGAAGGGVSNPLSIPTTNADVIWGPLVDVVDDYFEIRMEAPARLEDNVLIEGRIETKPQLSPTLLEPWR